jgi:hypothetical protein
MDERGCEGGQKEKNGRGQIEAGASQDSHRCGGKGREGDTTSLNHKVE